MKREKKRGIEKKKRREERERKRQIKKERLIKRLWPKRLTKNQCKEERRGAGR